MKTKVFVAVHQLTGLPLRIGCRGLTNVFIKGPVCNLYLKLAYDKQILSQD